MPEGPIRGSNAMKPGIRTLAAVTVALLVAGALAPLFAQSLADVARQEQERRKEIKEHAKVITNKDLGTVPVLAVPPAPSSTPAASTPASGTEAAPAATNDETAKSPAKEPAKDRTYWAKRMTELNQALDRDQEYLDAMQSRINGLTADFAARDDPAQRAIVEQNRQKALTEFGHLKQKIEADKKAIADLEEEARRAGVPPGWLRP